MKVLDPGDVHFMVPNSRLRSMEQGVGAHLPPWDKKTQKEGSTLVTFAFAPLTLAKEKAVFVRPPFLGEAVLSFVDKGNSHQAKGRSMTTSETGPGSLFPQVAKVHRKTAESKQEDHKTTERLRQKTSRRLLP